MKKVKRLVALATLLVLTTAMLPINIQAIPSIEDPTPGYWEISEYMIGSVAVGIILPESNGTVDPSTEDWTDVEIEKVLSEIQYALDWWASQNPDANVSFVTQVHAKVSTSRELINHKTSSSAHLLAYDEIMTNLGYPGTHPLFQLMDYANDLREIYRTDWAFIISVVDSSNDPDGCFEDGLFAYAAPGGPLIVMTYDNGYWGIDKMDRMCAHEMGHIFWATDEYNGRTEYDGYLNVPDVEGSGCIMDGASGGWCLSGKPHGLEGTWGQVGWRDSDDDGIQDIVDTFPRVYINSPEISQGKVNYTGVATVTSYPNNNPDTRNPEGRRDVTINKIKSIEFSVDLGGWIPANATDGVFGDSIEDFTFTTPQLSVGTHLIEVRATNQWGNYGYANATVEISELIADLNGDGEVDIRDITIVALAFGSKPGDPNWNAVADLNDDQEIDIRDVTIVALEWGKTV